MARSVDAIQKAIVDDVATYPELVPLTTNTSKRAIWRLWTWVTATAISLLEQLIDVFQTNVESTVALSAPQTAQWVQDKVFKFQYSATDPQIIQLIDLIPQYPTVNVNYRIVTRCSVKSNINNAVLVKAAKNEPPEALNSAELAALQSYIDTIGVAGIVYTVSSTASDKLFVQASIYYNGMYSSVIQASVISAIETYLASIPFDGIMKISDLELTIRNTAGVTDIVFENVKARRDSDTIYDATYLVQDNTLVNRSWATSSGYIVGETTSGNTLTDSLTFIAE